MSEQTSTSPVPTALVMQTAGSDLPLKHFASAKGNDCYGVLAKKADGTRYLSKYGVGIPALAAALPRQVTLVNGESKVTINLESGYTDSGNQKVSYNGALEVPGIGRRMVRINLSSTKSGWNVIAKVIPMGEGGSGRVTELSDLW